MTDRSVPIPVVTVVCLLLVGTACLMSLSSIALAGDGAYYLVRIIDTETVFGPELRFLGNASRQLPLLIAVRVGVTDTHVLSIVLGLGLLVVPTAAWCLAVIWARVHTRAFAAVAMTAGLCAGTTWFFAIGENVVAAPLIALVAVLLWLPQEWRWRHVVAAAAASTILVATYEATILTTPVFLLWAAWRARGSSSTVNRYGGALVALISAAGIAVAVAGILSGQERSPAHARSLLYFVVSLEPWQLYLGLVAIAGLVAAMTPGLEMGLRAILLASGSAAAVVVIYGLTPTTPLAFAARGGAAIAASLVQLFLFGLWIRARAPSREISGIEHRSRWPLLVPVAFVAAMALADVRALDRWSRSLDAFRAEVDTAPGLVQVYDVLPADRQQVVWGWTSSSISLIVRRTADAGILVDSSPSYVPFPPGSAHEQLADSYTWRW